MRNTGKIIVSVALVVASFSGAYGQSMNDIYNFQDRSIQYGTPRFMGMGGAFGALGGEISASYINPASGAVAVKNEISATLGVEWNANNSNYYGSSTKSTSDVKFSPFQAGVNFVLITRDDLTSFNSFSFGINYSRKCNFNNEVKWSGVNNTITDWVEGTPIGSSVVEYLYRNAVDGVNNTVTGLAEDLGVLGVYKTQEGQYFYMPEAEYNNISQAASLLTSGSSNVTTFSAGMNINNNIYVGIGFDFISINLSNNNLYLDEWGFTKNTGLSHDGLSNLYFDRYTSQSGWGSSFTVGIIGRVTDEFRLGFSWKTAARIYIDENYSYLMGAKFFDGTFNEGSENPTFDYPNRYSFKSPSEWTFSAAYVFGQHGILSVDYMLKDFSQMRFKDDGFSAENEIIKNQMQICHTVRVGGELRFYPVSIRAGFNYISSPYKNVTVNRVSQNVAGQYDSVSLPQGTGETMNASFGVGYNADENITIDLTYVGSKNTSYQYLYKPLLTNPMKNERMSHYIALGVTFRI
ncbi:MAG: outer membrane protein transport protein [Flavobacteriales bacterium]|nr:outer membrane protein transport protein [Flavobacteriales bacterium]